MGWNRQLVLCIVQVEDAEQTHPGTLTWNLKKEGLEDDSPFQMGDFRVSY